MNLLDRLLAHDLATTRELLQLCLELPDEVMDRDMDAGWRTLRKTFDHMIFNIETWTDLMLERPVESASNQGTSASDLLERLETSYAEFTALARRIEAEGRWDDLWTDVLDNPPQQKSFGGGIGHVITHNMHHRAELLHIMQRLGMKDLPEGDLMGWDMRQRIGKS
jgi:uncharacterized damage-inducible protein DinB